MSSKNLCSNKDSMDKNIEIQKAEKEKRERIEAKFLMFKDEERRVFCALGYMEKYFFGVAFLIYELYKEGMTPKVESALREKAKILGEGVDEILYERAVWKVESEDKISAAEKNNKT